MSRAPDAARASGHGPWLPATAACLLLLACRSHPPPGAAPRLGAALSAALTAAGDVRAPWRCAAPDLPALPDGTLEAGGHRWQVHDHTLHRDGPASGAVTIGFVADAGGAAPATLAALARLRAQLDQAAPDLVVTLGGMGAREPELEATLGVLAEHASYPVVALPGDLEPVAALQGAVAALHAHGAPIVDGRLAGWIELPGATIAAVPGAGAAGRLVAGDDGCTWAPDAPDAIYAELAPHTGLRIAVTAEPPREVLAGEPSGVRALVPPPRSVDVVVHGPAREAPSSERSGGRDGRAALLSPGTCDATPRLPDAHVPSAGVLVIRGARWTWRPVGDSGDSQSRQRR